MSNRSRSIVRRTVGTQHGFIRRMISPSELGQVTKPFVFLDYIHGSVRPGTGFGFHPHSGIATLTYSLNADAQYEDTTGQKGTIEATGIEWMRASGGTWHQGFIYPRAEKITAFQLWVSLPPGLEDDEPEGIYLSPAQVPQVGQVRVLLGEFNGVRNPIAAPSPINYLDVELRPEQLWDLQPAPHHDVAWAFVYQGSATIAGSSVAGELVVFEPGEGAIQVAAGQSGARILAGTAQAHAFPLVLGTHSVHTNRESLKNGVQRIQEIGDRLRAEGRFQ